MGGFILIESNVYVLHVYDLEKKNWKNTTDSMNGKKTHIAHSYQRTLRCSFDENGKS